MNKIRGDNLLWFIFQFGIKNLIPFITLPIFTRYISLEDFGIYALVIFYATIVTGIINLGLLNIYDRTFFELSHDKRKSLLYTVILFILFLFSIFFILTNSFQEVIAEFFFRKKELKNYLLIALWFQAFKTLNLYFLSYLKNYDKAKIHSYFTIAESSLSILLALLFVTNYSMGLYGFLLGQTLGVSLVFLVTFIYLFSPFNSKLEIKLLKQQLKLSLPLTPRIFFGVINNQFDRYMLGILSSLGGVGLYDIGQKIANTSFVFMTAIENAYSPEVYRRLFSRDKTIRESVGPFLTPFFYFSILFCLTVGLFSYEILYLLTPKDYHSATPVISILVILYGSYFFGKQPQLMFAKKTGLISFLTLISIGLNVGLNIPMIKYFGIMGAAWGTLLAGLISSAISFYYGQKYTPIKYEKTLLLIFLYFITIVFINLYLRDLNLNYSYNLLFKIMGLLVYGFIGYFLDIINIIKIKIFFKSLNR